jgi:hypothetical protein
MVGGEAVVSSVLAGLAAARANLQPVAGLL